MNNSTYEYDIKLFNEQIKGMSENISCDKALLVRYISNFYYNYIFHKYRNKYVLEEFIRIYNGIGVHEDYLYLTSKLVKKYKKTKSEVLYQACNDIINDLVDFQANRDAYFAKICDFYEVSLSGITYIQADNIKNLDKEYIKKLDEKFKRVI